VKVYAWADPPVLPRIGGPAIVRLDAILYARLAVAVVEFYQPEGLSLISTSKCSS
jgi:hypothetical protein